MRRCFLLLAAVTLLSTASGCYLMCGICDCDPPGPGYGLHYATGVGALPPGVAARPIAESEVSSTPAKSMPKADR